MNVLIPSEETQEILIIPRSYTALSGITVILIEDGSGKKQTIEDVVGQVVGNYVQLSVRFTILVLNSTYYMEVQDSLGSVIYKGKVFCTRRTNKATKPSLNTGLYTEHTVSNLNQKYIIVGGGSTDEEPIGGGGSVTECFDEGEMAAATSSFQICDMYCVEVDGTTYNDWYVPSRGEVEAFLADGANQTNNMLESYGYDRIPVGVITPPFTIDAQYLWTSTEVSQSQAFQWQMPLYGPNVRNERKDRSEAQNLDLPYVVRPFRFQAKSESDSPQLITGDRHAGGVIATTYTLNGTEGWLIVSPTQPKPGEHIFWSDLGQTVTGATSETDGAANSAIVLALENA
jgi:hypothetical protein